MQVEKCRIFKDFPQIDYENIKATPVIEKNRCFRGSPFTEDFGISFKDQKARGTFQKNYQDN